jgi:hypothetical protein
MIGIRTGNYFWEIIENLHSEIPDNEIVQALINHEVQRDEIDYIELAPKDKELLISYIPSNRLPKINKLGQNVWDTSYRQECKIGKALNKILIYPVNSESIKTFVERAQKTASANAYEVNIYPSTDIPKYYLESNCIESPNSELGKSCMRHKKCQKYFDIYTNNPNLQIIVCLKNGLVAARALLWSHVSVMVEEMEMFQDVVNLKELPKLEGLVVLDRIYSVNPVASHMLKSWAKDKCDLMLTKAKQPHAFTDVRNGNVYNPLILSQPLKNWRYKFYPYVDTFSIYNPKTGILTNYLRGKYKGQIKFSDIEGMFTRIDTQSPSYEIVVEELGE